MVVDTKKTLIKQTFLSELISLAVNFIVGIILTVVLLPIESFGSLILMVPGLLSLRGNIAGSFNARIACTLMVGNFKFRRVLENILAVLSLTMVSSILIGIIALGFSRLFLKETFIAVPVFFLIPIITMYFELLFSIPISLGFNKIVFKKGLNPNNIVGPIMTSIDDILITITFYVALLFMGVI